MLLARHVPAQWLIFEQIKIIIEFTPKEELKFMKSIKFVYLFEEAEAIDKKLLDRILKYERDFINKNEDPIARFRSDNMTKLGLAICLAGIVITGFASGIFEMIRNMSYGI